MKSKMFSYCGLDGVGSGPYVAVRLFQPKVFILRIKFFYFLLSTSYFLLILSNMTFRIYILTTF